MPRSDAGWTNAPDELAEVRLLQSLAVQREGLNADNLPPEVFERTREVLVQQRLVTVSPTPVDRERGEFYDGHLTELGRALVAERFKRQGDRMARAEACREALLDWCYWRDDLTLNNFLGNHVRDHYVEGDPFTYEYDTTRDVRAYFEGVPFTFEDMKLASDELVEAGFIEIRDNQPRVTYKGKQVVRHWNSSIRDYERREQGMPGIHITTGSNSQVSTGNHSVLNQVNGGVPEEFEALVTAALDASRGTPAEQDVAKGVSLLSAVHGEDEHEVVKTGIKKLQEALSKAGTALATSAISALLKYAEVKMIGA